MMIKPLYKVLTIEGGICQFTSTERKFCLQWVEDNNFDTDGNCLNLYCIIRS